MTVTDREILNFVITFEQELFASEKIPFSRDKGWSSKFPYKAGIYAIYDHGELIYIGESANLKLRMQEIKRTYNHSIKRILNNRHYKGVLEGRVYSAEIEEKLNQHLLEHVTFAAKELNFGRLEMESYLMHRNKSKVLNKIGRRNAIPELKDH